MAQECVFCKIIEGKVPCFKIYEDETFLAFLDIYPVCEGHTLVVPKKHYRWVWDLPDDLYAKYWLVAKKVALFLQNKLGTDFVRVVVEGELVPHAHIQLQPEHNDNIRRSQIKFASNEERMNFVKNAYKKTGVLKEEN